MVVVPAKSRKFMSAQPVTGSLGARCILVVDGEIEIRFSLAQHLRSAGFTVFEAYSSDEALTLLGAMPFDAVIADFQTPGAMNGLALADLARSTFPHILTVIVSGVDLSHELERTQTAFFQKPYEGAAIVDLVIKTLVANDN